MYYKGITKALLHSEKRMDAVKQVKTFRLSPAVISVVAKAAEAAGLSEGDIIEGCVIAQAENVVAARERQMTRLASEEAVRSVAAAGRSRPRDERSDKGTTKGAGAPAGLRKSQQS